MAPGFPTLNTCAVFPSQQWFLKQLLPPKSHLLHCLAPPHPTQKALDICAQPETCQLQACPSPSQHPGLTARISRSSSLPEHEYVLSMKGQETSASWLLRMVPCRHSLKGERGDGWRLVSSEPHLPRLYPSRGEA